MGELGSPQPGLVVPVCSSIEGFQQHADMTVQSVLVLQEKFQIDLLILGNMLLSCSQIFFLAHDGKSSAFVRLTNDKTALSNSFL